MSPKIIITIAIWKNLYVLSFLLLLLDYEITECYKIQLVSIRLTQNVMAKWNKKEKQIQRLLSNNNKCNIEYFNSNNSLISNKGCASSKWIIAVDNIC